MAPENGGSKTFVAQLSWLRNEGCRLDASAYVDGSLATYHGIVNGKWDWLPLDSLARLFKAPRYLRRYVFDRTRGTSILSSSDILLADLNSVPLLSDKTPVLSELLLKEGWTLISRSGTIGNTAYVRPEMDGMAASEHVMRVAPDQTKIWPGYLFAFLSTLQGNSLLKRRTYGSIIQHIEPHHIADLPVPLPEPSEQERLHNLVARAAAARTEASRLLNEAAAYFDGLAGPMPSAHDHARVAEIVKRSTLNGRLDAFHYVGWAAEKTVSGDRLDSIANVAIPGRMRLVHAQAGAPFFTGVDLTR